MVWHVSTPFARVVCACVSLRAVVPVQQQALSPMRSRGAAHHDTNNRATQETPASAIACSSNDSTTAYMEFTHELGNTDEEASCKGACVARKTCMFWMCGHLPGPALLAIVRSSKALASCGSGISAVIFVDFRTPVCDCACVRACVFVLTGVGFSFSQAKLPLAYTQSYVYRPISYPDHSSPNALAMANNIMTRLTIPGGQ